MNDSIQNEIKRQISARETRMTTSISSKAIWNFKKYVWTSENLKIEIKYQPRDKCFYTFTFLPFVAWLTDWYVKQKVEKRV